MLKLLTMTSDKNQKLRISRSWLKSLTGFLTLMASIFSLNLIFASQTYALFTPSLSAALNQSSVVFHGSDDRSVNPQFQEATTKLTINSNDKSGYRIIVSTDSNNTSLVSPSFAVTDKINSIPHADTLSNFPDRTWGYKIDGETNFRPIGSVASPTNLFDSEEKTDGNEIKNITIGMNLGANLLSGSYKNTLMISVISNNNAGTNATLTRGPDLNQKIARSAMLAGANLHAIKGFKRSLVAPSAAMKTINIEDPDESSYEILAWFDPADKTVYYYCENDRVYMNDDSRQIFNNIINITDIDLSGLNTRYVKDMSFMFNNARSVVNLDLSNFKTSRVTSMINMFAYMGSLKNLNISSFKTKNVKSFSRMFMGDSSLQNLDLSNFDTTNVTDMGNMFSGASNLTSLDLGNFNTANVVNMQEMFKDCGNLTSLNVSSFDTAKVTNMQSMFGGATKLTSLDIRNFDTSKVTNMLSMFGNLRSLTDFKISDKFKTTNVTNMASMFANCILLDELDLSNFDTRKVISTSAMFSGMSNVKKIILGPNFQTSNVVNMNSMFNNCNLLQEINLSSFDTRKVTDFTNMFNYCSNLTSLDVSTFNTSEGISMSGMFSGMLNLTNLNLGHNFNTSKVNSLYNMFFNNRKLVSLDLSQFDTSNVTNMASMFSYMFELKNLNISSFNTSKVESMYRMFYNSSKLENLDLSHFDTSSVHNMQDIFAGMTALTSINLGGRFSTANVTDMRGMFTDVNSLTELDLSNFNTAKVNKFSNMFASSRPLETKLEKIYVSQDFNISAGTEFNNVFQNQVKLRGGNGSFLVNPASADKTWLRIDRPGAKGYFTQKP